MRLAIIDDKIIPYDELTTPYLDRGIYFGDGVYEVVRSYEGRIFALEDHLERFSRSLAEIRIKGIDIDEVRRKVITAFEKAEIPNAKIYFHVTRGSALRSHGWDEHLKPNFFLTVTELGDSTELKRKGIKVSTHPDWRWKRCDIKSLNLLANVLARHDAEQKGCYEAILVDEEGLITEGAGSSFFAMWADTIKVTPLSKRVLPSITRKYALKAAEKVGLKVVNESITPAQARTADELFIAVTTKDIVGVVEFDGKRISGSQPGKYTRMLEDAFKEFVA